MIIDKSNDKTNKTTTNNSEYSSIDPEIVKLMQSFIPDQERQLFTSTESPFYIVKDSLYYEYRENRHRRDSSGHVVIKKYHKYTISRNNKLIKYCMHSFDKDYYMGIAFFLFLSPLSLCILFSEKPDYMLFLLLLLISISALVNTFVSHLIAKKRMEKVWQSKRQYIPIKDDIKFE